MDIVLELTNHINVRLGQSLSFSISRAPGLASSAGRCNVGQSFSVPSGARLNAISSQLALRLICQFQIILLTDRHLIRKLLVSSAASLAVCNPRSQACL